MTLSDLVTIEPFGFTVNKAIDAAKTLMGVHSPYRYEQHADGTLEVVLTPHYILLCEIALDTNSLAEMGIEETKFWLEGLKYRTDVADGVRDEFVQDIGVVQTQAQIHEAALQVLAEWVAARGE